MIRRACQSVTDRCRLCIELGGKQLKLHKGWAASSSRRGHPVKKLDQGALSPSPPPCGVHWLNRRSSDTQSLWYSKKRVKISFRYDPLCLRP
jgi:hypothetical protein